MARKAELPPSLAVRAFHEALLEVGIQPGHVFEGDAWEDALIVGFDVLHHQTLRQYTRLGRAHRLWEVEVGGGRGNKTKVTMLAAAAVELAIVQPAPVAA
ncbi:MAG: hypothetical protein WC876_04520 [Candidatus Thermoplasmatota archaeon]|jgi:hypothetical protein